MKKKIDEIEQHVERIQHENQCSVSVTRGQRGTVGWDIKVYSDNPQDAAKQAAEVDKQLSKLYLD